jgi:hypothetical protein
MLTENQITNIKNIYTLFTNISDSANIWIQELNINDEIETHKEKLTIIMNLITNLNEMINGKSIVDVTHELIISAGFQAAFPDSDSNEVFANKFITRWFIKEKYYDRLYNYYRR